MDDYFDLSCRDFHDEENFVLADHVDWSETDIK